MDVTLLKLQRVYVGVALEEVVVVVAEREAYGLRTLRRALLLPTRLLPRNVVSAQ